MWKELVKRHVICGLPLLVAYYFLYAMGLHQNETPTINNVLFWLRQLTPVVFLLTSFFSINISVAWFDLVDNGGSNVFYGLLPVVIGGLFGVFALVAFLSAFGSVFMFPLGTIVAIPLFLFMRSKKIPPLQRPISA